MAWTAFVSLAETILQLVLVPLMSTVTRRMENQLEGKLSGVV